MPISRRGLLGGLAATPLALPIARATRKTNVVLFVTDDHGAWAMGPWGCPEIQTPNLARMAAHGTRFTNAFACTPVCSPSRMTYLTGKLPSGHGVQDALPMNDLTGPHRKRFL